MGLRVEEDRRLPFRRGLLFERDDFGNDVMDGLSPDPAPRGENEVFDRAAAVFRNAFTLARRLGVKTCVGDETPLTVPAPVQERLAASGRDPKDPAVVKDLYKAMFGASPRPIPSIITGSGRTRAGPGTTPAGSDRGRDHGPGHRRRGLEEPPRRSSWPPAAGSSARRRTALFSTRSCPGRGHELDQPRGGQGAGRARASPHPGRSLWAIPWIEDDPALTSPQLWAAGCARDAADALRYGCDGLLGIHWRTRVLSANVLALARAAWTRAGTPCRPCSTTSVRHREHQLSEAESRRRVAAATVGVEPRLRLPHPCRTNYAVTLQFVER